MYSEIVKSEAFILWCQGISSRRIAEHLRERPDCEKISKSTIDGWASEPDARGRTWEDKKVEYMALVEVNQQGAIVKQHIDIIAETEKIKEDLLDKIKPGGGLIFKTRDAAIYAFLAVAKYQDHVKDKKKRITIEEQVTLFIEAMNEITEVKEVLSRHWPEIDRRFQEKAAALQREKKRGGD